MTDNTTLQPFGEYRPDLETRDSQFSANIENVFQGENSYLPFPSLANLATAAQSLASGGNDSYTKVLLHFDGADASTTFTDTAYGAANSHTWTAAADAQIDTAQSVFGGASGLFDGTGDWISSADDTDYTLGSSDFTVDVRARPATSGALLYICGQGNNALSAATTSFFISRTAANKVEAQVSNGSAFTTLTGSSTTFTSGSWKAIRLARVGNTLNLFMDGALEATASFSGSVNNSSNAFRIGAGGEVTTTPWNGWLDEFRLDVGIARDNGVAYTVPGVAYYLGGTCVGLMAARTAAGSFVIFAGTAIKLFKWSSAGWTDVSRTSGGNYNIASGDLWMWQQVGTFLYATNINDVLQRIDVDSGTNFAAVSGSPPQATNIAQIGPHTVLSGLSSNRRKIQWSATENPTGWTVGTSLSDEQEMPDGGPVQGVAGDEIGYVVQDKSIRLMQYLPGDTATIFSFSRVLQDRGSVSKYGFMTYNNVLYFLAEDGFYSLQGANLLPIGEEKVNTWFLANSDPARRNVVQAIRFPNHSRVGWAYHGSSTATTYDKMIVFDIQSGRWTLATISAQIWGSIASTGLDLDTTGGEPGDALLDSAAASLDSYIYIGGRATLGAIDPNGLLSFHNGPSLQAILETAEFHPVLGARGLVTQVYPLIDVSGRSNVTVTSITREQIQDTPDTGATESVEETGWAYPLVSARLHRYRATIAAGAIWQHAQGVLVAAQPDGEF